jgi:hypothetical protein
MKPTEVILTFIGRGGGPTKVKGHNPNHVPVPRLPLHSSRSSHAPRRQAADLTGSCATPPGRRPHRITRRAAPPPTSLAHASCHPTVQLTGTRTTPPLPPARPPVLVGRPPSRSATGPRRLALVTPTPDLADHHRLRARASTEKARSGRG